jgi:hypothetical protein
LPKGDDRQIECSRRLSRLSYHSHQVVLAFLIH